MYIKTNYDDTKHLLDKEKLKKYNKQYREKTGYNKIKYNWYSSMGGSPYKNNNSLLRIDTTIFN